MRAIIAFIVFLETLFFEIAAEVVDSFGLPLDSQRRPSLEYAAQRC